MSIEETYTQFNAPSPRSVLSSEEFERYVAEGAAMGLDEVVAYALDDPPAGVDVERLTGRSSTDDDPR
jgi:hypothetical protein